MLQKGNIITLTEDAQSEIEQIGYVNHEIMTPHSVKPMEYVVIGHDMAGDPFVINRDVFKPEMLVYNEEDTKDLIYCHPFTFWVEDHEVATVNGVAK
jgi:hypothetical protein